jgi:hypothetical protein
VLFRILFNITFSHFWCFLAVVGVFTNNFFGRYSKRLFKEVHYQTAPDYSEKPEVCWLVGGRTCSGKREATLAEAINCLPKKISGFRFQVSSYRANLKLET